MTDSANIEAFAVRQRRKYRHAEWREQIRLTKLLTRYLPDNVFWSALSNAPRTALGGYLAQKRGVRSGLADIMVVHDGRVTFVELKSPVGVASKAQRQVYVEMRAAGADWYLVKSAPAALEALRRSNVPFRRRWKPPQLAPWEGPFANPHRRLPQHPEVAAQRRAAQRAWRERQRDSKAAKLAAERNNASCANNRGRKLRCRHEQRWREGGTDRALRSVLDGRREHRVAAHQIPAPYMLTGIDRQTMT